MTTLAEAKEFATALLKKTLAEHGLSLKDGKVYDMVVAMKGFLERYDEPNTYRSYATDLVKYFLPYAYTLDKPLADLEEEDIAPFWDYMGELSRNSRVRAMKSIMAFLNLLRRREKKRQLSGKLVRYENPDAVLSFEQKILLKLTREDINAVRDNMPTLEHALAVELMAGSGMRPAEALGLRWGNLIWEKRDGVDFVKAELKHRPGEYGAKGKYGERVVPLSPTAVSLVKRIMFENGIDNSYEETILEKNIIPYDHTWLYKEFKRTSKLVGVDKKLTEDERNNLRPHICRHLFAVEALKSGMDIATLKEMMKISMKTLETYIRLAGVAVADEYFEKVWKPWVEKKKAVVAT
ncbi:MAG: tyrosine-type recombinase/integrase [Nitrososphaeria archaeon]